MLELSQREALQLGCSYIGTEHILLGLIREGEGVAAQVLIKRGADLNRLRQQVIQILGDSRGEEELGTAHPAPRTGPAGGRQSRLLPEVLSRAEPADALRAAAGQRAGTGPDVSDLDQQIAQARRDMASAVSTEDYESAATLRDRERQLLAEKASRHQQRATAHLDLPSLAEGLGWLGDDVGRIRGLLRQQGAGPAAASSTSGRSRQ
jgi:ATP-dependent Clp protease ATP-binding subunit ClpC